MYRATCPALQKRSGNFIPPPPSHFKPADKRCHFASGADTAENEYDINAQRQVPEQLLPQALPTEAYGCPGQLFSGFGSPCNCPPNRGSKIRTQGWSPPRTAVCRWEEDWCYDGSPIDRSFPFLQMKPPTPQFFLPP